ncbi:hypothetical protein MAM1_0416c10411 [Mucor ambiguus]|uniref:Uncharacterized protein n=1 Tax=Mucor ambiguus TaxID=91626 RepID=A0A0C9MJ37_9FUNG|nr:hypothetical protein MAM1_0416c10411 [Mucor ambiguus]
MADAGSNNPHRQESSCEISEVTRQTYEDCISQWIRQALKDGRAFWNFDRRVDSADNAASVKAVYEFVKMQIDHKVLSSRADQRAKAQADWSYFDKERIFVKIKHRFSNDCRRNREQPGAQEARLRAERRKQRRTKAAALVATYGSACLNALKAEEVQSDEESDAEDSSKAWRVYLPLCRMHHPKLEAFYNDLIKAINEQRSAENQRLGSKSVKTHPRTDDCSRPSAIALSAKAMRHLNESDLLAEKYDL